MTPGIKRFCWANGLFAISTIIIIITHTRTCSIITINHPHKDMFWVLLSPAQGLGGAYVTPGDTMCSSISLGGLERHLPVSPPHFPLPLIIPSAVLKILFPVSFFYILFSRYGTGGRDSWGSCCTHPVYGTTFVRRVEATRYKPFLPILNCSRSHQLCAAKMVHK